MSGNRLKYGIVCATVVGSLALAQPSMAGQGTREYYSVNAGHITANLEIKDEQGKYKASIRSENKKCIGEWEIFRTDKSPVTIANRFYFLGHSMKVADINAAVINALRLRTCKPGDRLVGALWSARVGGLRRG